MAVAKIQDISKTRENMNEKSKIVMKNDNKRTYVIAQEIKLAKVLAGNNKTLRDRALKRLKRWIQFRSHSTPFTENDFMRIWKGLFYAMWMSDKPLLQEECAEMIASLVHLTTTNYSLMFFKCGLKTLGNEWFGIDQLRLDKFLMFVRRLLRQGFVILKNNSWNLKTIKEFNNIISATVLSIDNPPPVGLTMHFTEVYLEELAKVSEGNLKPNLVTEFVNPFIKQLALLKDGRQITCIIKNIFHYIIKQSDVGTEYEEKFRAWKQQGFPGGSINSMQKEEISDDEKMSDDEDDEELNKNASNKNIMDPRAGHVDVVLPQLKFIPKQIIEILNQNKFVDGSNSKSRKAISNAIEEFTHLSKGEYPLGMKKIDIPKNDSYSTRTKNAVNRLVKFENKLLNKTNKKRKHENENNAKEPDAKRKRKNSESTIELFSDKLAEFVRKSENNIKVKTKKTKDIKTTKTDQKTRDKVKKSNKVKVNKDIDLKLEKKKLDVIDGLKNKVKTKTIKSLMKPNEAEKGITKPIGKKKIPKRHLTKGVEKKLIVNKASNKNYECVFKRNSGIWFVYDHDCSGTSSMGDSSMSESAIITDDDATPSKSTKFENSTSSLIESPKVNGDAQVKIEKNPEQKSKCSKSTPRNSTHYTISQDLFKQDEWDVPLKDGETEIFVESKKYKMKTARLNNSAVETSKTIMLSKLRKRSLDSQIVKNPFAKMSPPGGSKKVKIALNLNKEQDIHEHVAQIKSSPGIPFDANKKPSKPLLKRHTMSPIDPFYRRKLHM